MTSPLTLRAGSLTLEPLGARHVGEMWQALTESVEQLRPYLAWVETIHSPTDLERFVARARVARDDGLEYIFAALGPDGIFCGVVGLHNVDHRNRNAEMGFWMRTSRTRRGICQAMAARAMRFAFREIGLHRIFIRHAVDNLTSRSVIEKLGYLREGTAREDTFLRGQWLTHETYSMLAAEYDELAPALLRLEEAARFTPAAART